MSMKKLIGAVCTTFALLTASTAMAAPTYGVDFTGIGASANGSLWGLGYQFVANNASTVTGLGVYDNGRDGLAGTQHVGLWDASGNLLASTYVTDSDALNGYWRFHDISGVTLVAGNTYYVASQGGEGYSWVNSGFSVDPNITFVRDAWVYIGSGSNDPLAFPVSTSNLTASFGGGFFGGNIELNGSTNVPEPVSLSLVALGLAALGATRRKRN